MHSVNPLLRIITFTMMSAMIFAVTATQIFAGGIDDAKTISKQTVLWQKADAARSMAKSPERHMPEKYVAFSLDQRQLLATISKMPQEKESSVIQRDVILDVPMPDGSISHFRIEENNVLADHLAKDFPTWKTFQGTGIEDPSAFGRFDWNSLGFHGYVSTPKGIVMIDPRSIGDTQNYLVYFKHDYGTSDVGFYCRTEQQVKKFIDTRADLDDSLLTPDFSFGGSVRTYRLAIATTGEWARNAAGYNGTQNPTQIRTAALAVITTAVNRLNGIYTRELASTFQLVNPSISNNATNIIFDDPATDPYDNTDGIPQLALNQTTITNRVGTANFDIGHLFGTGGGGVASSPSLCSDTSKAEGYSARGNDTGDPFVVDYVSHEMGHQFGADHTYNNSDPSGACTTRSATDAFEVASGATIMSYVGICSQRNLQQYVDTGFPSFHIRSLTTINTNITTGDPATTGCGTANGTNAIPTVTAGASFTIPKLTPFTLTASAGDADGGDVANLLYSWEEYDLAAQPSGALGTPANTYDVDTDGVLRPLFRAYSPVASNSRTFPSMTFILNPANNTPAGSNQPPLTYTGTHPSGSSGAVCEPAITCVIGERLPEVGRTMNFRVSVRDRRGGVRDDGTQVTVAAAAGPFQITAQNSLAPNVAWSAGTTQAVTWDVAGTSAAPISVANVKISLSTDGGLTFPITLLASTPNTGSANVVVPNNQTTTARIKVEAIGNIFFDINNVNFAITAPTAAGVTVSGRVLTADGRGLKNAMVFITDSQGVRRQAITGAFGSYRFDDVAAGDTYVISVLSRRFNFAPRVLNVTDNLGDVDFIAEQ